MPNLWGCSQNVSPESTEPGRRLHPLLQIGAQDGDKQDSLVGRGNVGCFADSGLRDRTMAKSTRVPISVIGACNCEEYRER